MDELLNMTRLIVVVATIVVTIKVLQASAVSEIISAMGGFVNALAKFGAVFAGVAGVFAIGMTIFIGLGGEVILPSSIRFADDNEPPTTPSLTSAGVNWVNWDRVWPAVARWRSEIEAASKKCDVDPALIAAVMRQESVGNPNICSKAGACGLMQLMPAAAKDMRVADRFDPGENTRGGACYLRQMLDKYGKLDLALAAYNAGAGNVDKYGGVPPFAETQKYVRRVTGFYEEIVVHEEIAVSNSGCCIWPTTGRITQGASADHMAIDIAATIGTPVVAAASGKVIAAASGGNYGKRVMIDHGGGLLTLYAHLSEILVREGDRVGQGQIVGKVGSTGLSTGPHLHFEIRERGQLLDPFPRLR